MRRAFTLLEILIVLSIFSIITVLVFSDGRRFGQETNLTNSIYDTMLSIREAQTYSLSVRKVEGVDGFAGHFGVYFNKNDNRKIIIFADRNASLGYDDGDEIIRTDSLSDNIIISDLCVGNSTSCSAITGGQLNVVFRRPNAQAYINTNNKEGRICLSGGSSVKHIKITDSGQMTINDGCF